MSDESYWIPAFVAWLACACRLPALAHAPRDPLLRAVCAVLFLSGTTFFFANPSAIGYVNELTGIPNVAAPLVYTLLNALSASCVVLIVYWRGGPQDKARDTARRWMLGYAAATILLIVLFALGDAPIEHRVDLDTHHATTPFIREMIVLYLVCHTVAAITMSVMCWRWSKRVTPRSWLRRGLRIIVIGYVLNLGYDITKFAAVGARWANTNWDGLSTLAAPPIAALGTLFTATGFVLPLLMPLLTDRLSQLRDTLGDYRDYRALRPLWDELRTATPGIVAPVPVPWWDISIRLTRRIAEIHDGCLALRPYLDGSAAATALIQAHDAGLDDQEAKAAAESAVLLMAIWRKITGNEPDTATASTEDLPFDLTEPLQLGALIRISRALRTSPVAAGAHRTAQLEMNHG